ncbi:MAG: hypothetical protein E7074_10490 [Bacteroidales bacterium]|nr:hypothetical protein [Bacteroidales bacterium]
MTLEEFVRKNREADVRALALHMRQYPEMDAAFALQQIEGWQKARQKLPELAAIDGWLWPKRVSVEQSSSQATAIYKRQMLSKVKGRRSGELIDLTGGMGVDCYYLSEGFEEVHYVERDEELCRLAEKNFALAGKKVQVHHCSAEEWLKVLTSQAQTIGRAVQGYSEDTTIFVDPARRDKNGGKVFRLEDCEPNVVELLIILRACAGRVLMKLSPMLDITAAVRSLGGAAEVHVVAVKNEVKEVLVLIEGARNKEQRARTGADVQGNSMDPEITCVNLETEEEAFVFRKSEEEGENRSDRANETNRSNGTNGSDDREELWLVEPNGAIMKAGGWTCFGEKYGLEELGPNSHLFCVPGDPRCMQESPKAVRRIYGYFCGKEGAEKLLPGRVFRVKIASKEELKTLNQANVICRNYPMSAEALKKKLRVRDGGEKYVIASQIGSKPVLFLGVRQFLHN